VAGDIHLLAPWIALHGGAIAALLRHPPWCSAR